MHRLHYEDGILNIESFSRKMNIDQIRRHIPEAVTVFDEPNLYFGSIARHEVS